MTTSRVLRKLQYRQVAADDVLGGIPTGLILQARKQLIGSEVISRAARKTSFLRGEVMDK